MNKNIEKMKRKAKKNLSDIQSGFIDAIDFEKLDAAINNPDFIKVLNKIKLK